MKILVTGIAGFIGSHLAGRLAAQGETVIGIDNINDYYDVDLKYGRLADLGLQAAAGPAKIQSTRYPSLSFRKMDLTGADAVHALFAAEQFDLVVHLAAQAGVRYSLTNPQAYITSNIQGFLAVLEAIRAFPVRHLVYASSSSVYGLDSAQPFSEDSAADHPVSLYAATKRANELMAYSYSHLYGIPSTGLRFFTVYGPWGRPDMAPFLFTKAILEGRPIDVFNHGQMRRDFTYITDIVEGIVRVMDKAPGRAGPPVPEAAASSGAHSSTAGTPVPARIYNIGNGAPVSLLDFIHALEDELGLKARMNMLPPQAGDVPVTWADCGSLEAVTGCRPHTGIREGIRGFVAWYRRFYSRV
ncbi:MAG: NAD-dependent epimerase/dehydratase family protein [Treponema sp.]|jgi:UDP-glucuronate 4-epimerase|nr:NAD-dependent epimerase/dehydratase family protein [Treponema sp.]